jgi:hypothetical protein
MPVCDRSAVDGEDVRPGARGGKEEPTAAGADVRDTDAAAE